MEKLKGYMRAFFTKPEYVFLVPALIFGVLSATLTPQLIANDENMHFIRSYELSNLETGHICRIPSDVKDRGFYEIYTRDKPNYGFSNKKVDTTQQIQTDCGTATSYNPILHAPQTIGVIFAKLVWPTSGGMILFGRLLNVLVYCVGIFFIIRKTKIGKWPLTVIALLPLMIHMAGTLSGDIVNNLALIGFIVYGFNLFVQKKPMSMRQVIYLVLLSGFLAVAKPPYLALLMIVLFLPKRVIPSIHIGRRKLTGIIARLTITSICAIASLAVIAGWTMLYVGDIVATSNIVNPVSQDPQKFIGILVNTYINPNIIFEGVSYSDWLYRSMFGSFASFKYNLPFTLVALLAMLFVFVGLRKDQSEYTFTRSSIKGLAVVASVSLLAVILAITYALYSAWAIKPFVLGEGATYALGLQGRYFTPLLLLLVPAMIYLRKYISVNFKEGVTTGVVVFFTTTLTLSFYLVQTVEYTRTLIGS